MGASFLCICPPKTIRFDQSKDNSKAEISSRLSAVGAFQSPDASQIHCPGAGLVFSPSPDLSVTTQETCFAVFKGRLDNYPYLVRKYCVRRLQQDATPTLNQIKQAAPLTAAEVVCELYQTLGTSFLPKLKGDFAFLCFDSQKVRVLATRASAGDTVMDGSVTSDATSKTNKTRRGKRGGKKQRENSQIRRMQSVPQSVSPMLASSPSGSQADRKDWWRSSASDKDTSPLRQAANAADDGSQGDAMSTVSLTDIPMARALLSPATASAIDPALLPGHADAAWGSQDTAEGTDDLLFRLSSAFSQGGSRLPTVVEHMEEGMPRPQSLADLSKAGWTVDSVLSRCSSQANVTRMARISSFPELGTMPEGTLSSGSPLSAFPEYPSQQQLADLGTQMSAAFSGLSSAFKPSQVAVKSASMLNPLAITHIPQSDAMMLGGNGVDSGVINERADKAVARRLLLKKRTPSFNKSKSCNDLVSVEPKSPTRSPFAPLANLAQTLCMLFRMSRVNQNCVTLLTATNVENTLWTLYHGVLSSLTF
ncbi:hypothetical protein WJX79_007773 [Trebouxia sp. C0005]